MRSLATLYGSLAHLHGAGIPWPEAFAHAAPDGADRAWRGARAALQRGAGLADALEGVVPPLDLAGLRAGEASGRLEPALRELARRHEEEDRLARERRAGLAYPMLVAHVAALLLPLPDLLAGRYGAALRWSLAVLLPLHALLALQRRARRAARRGEDPSTSVLARLTTSRATVEEADARALAALGWLHEAGVPWTQALPLAQAAGAGGRAAADLREARALVAAGRPLQGAWRRLPAGIAAGLATGETAGRFGDACRHAAIGLEESARLHRAVSRARLLVGLILFLGLVVGARVVTFYADALSLARTR